MCITCHCHGSLINTKIASTTASSVARCSAIHHSLFRSDHHQWHRHTSNHCSALTSNSSLFFFPLDSSHVNTSITTKNSQVIHPTSLCRRNICTNTNSPFDFHNSTTYTYTPHLNEHTHPFYITQPTIHGHIRSEFNSQHPSQEYNIFTRFLQMWFRF